jgi:hypothetical protein
LKLLPRWLRVALAFIAGCFAVLAARHHLARRADAKRRADAISERSVAAVAHTVLGDERDAQLKRANAHADRANAAGEAARDRVKQLKDAGHNKLADLVKRWNAE